jgi:hypothetical protein
MVISITKIIRDGISAVIGAPERLSGDGDTGIGVRGLQVRAQEKC